MERETGIRTPGTADDKKNEGDEKELEMQMITPYRRSTAMCIYMALDRADIAFAAKEVAREMKCPTEGGLRKLKRLIRYLIHRPTVALHFQWQDKPSSLEVYSDSDWGGCVKTRRSTSGGLIFHGRHLIHHWSSTQSVVALSSAEAELNAIIKAASESIGVKNMIKECGGDIRIAIKTDSSAANGVTHRQGSGKVKHLEVRQLWIQEKVANSTLQVSKVPREFNPSDALTHYSTVRDRERHLRTAGLYPYHDSLHGVPLD